MIGLMLFVNPEYYWPTPNGHKTTMVPEAAGHP